MIQKATKQKGTFKVFYKRIIIYVFSVLLIVYSLLTVNQGVTVTDTGYNYGNYIFYDSLDPMWKFSTILSLLLGNLFTKFPLGHNMLALNLYTGLVKAIISLLIFFICVYSFNMKPVIVFLAELLSLGLCWCPTALLYNYLTYLLFSLSAASICIGVKKQKIIYNFLSGVLLGINVFVRLPNLAEICLIFAVWFYCYISGKTIHYAIRITILCILGYLTGICSILLFISCRYGLTDYIYGIHEMIAASNEASSYSLSSMIKGDIISYLKNCKWLAMAFVPVIVGTIGNYRNKKGSFISIISSTLLLILYKVLGLFDFRYYNYSSIEDVGILFLLLTITLGTIVVLYGGDNYTLRIHAATTIIIILITPLGSNNQLFSAINNLFWVTPFVFHCCYKWDIVFKNIPLKKAILDSIQQSAKLTFIILTSFVTIQGILFGAFFVFRDGINGEKRTYLITEIPALEGIYTQPSNAIALIELHTFLVENEFAEKEVLLFNNVPGLAFYLNLTPALSSTWPDLDSYGKDKFKNELQNICTFQNNNMPIIIIGDELDNTNQKHKYLINFIYENEYQLVFYNESYKVFASQCN